jgi:hypothetical protein
MQVGRYNNIPGDVVLISENIQNGLWISVMQYVK